MPPTHIKFLCTHKVLLRLSSKTKSVSFAHWLQIWFIISYLKYNTTFYMILKYHYGKKQRSILVTVLFLITMLLMITLYGIPLILICSCPNGGLRWISSICTMYGRGLVLVQHYPKLFGM